MPINNNQLRHCNLDLKYQEMFLRHSLYKTLSKAVSERNKKIGKKIIDVGVGRGELLQLFQAQGFETFGIDIEKECVNYSKKYGTCAQGDIGEIKKLFPGIKFDVVVCSHVLEHLNSPFEALRDLASLRASCYIFAVPNLIRPNRILRALFKSSTGDHPEHSHSWGQPEFETILQRCGYRVEKRYADRVTINPIQGVLGQAITYCLNPIETKLLPNLFPMFSSSIINRCHLQEKEYKSE